MIISVVQSYSRLSSAVGTQLPRPQWAKRLVKDSGSSQARCQVLLNGQKLQVSLTSYETEILKLVAGVGIESNWRGLVVKFETGKFKLAKILDTSFVRATHYQEAKDSIAIQGDPIKDYLLESPEILENFGTPVVYSAAIFNGVGYLAMFMSPDSNGRLQGNISSEKIGGFILGGPERLMSGVLLFQITDQIRLMRAYKIQWPEAPTFLHGSLNPLAQQSLQALINSDAMTFALLRAGSQR